MPPPLSQARRHRPLGIARAQQLALRRRAAYLAARAQQARAEWPEPAAMADDQRPPMMQQRPRGRGRGRRSVTPTPVVDDDYTNDEDEADPVDANARTETQEADGEPGESECAVAGGDQSVHQWWTSIKKGTTMCKSFKCSGCTNRHVMAGRMFGTWPIPELSELDEEGQKAFWLAEGNTKDALAQIVTRTVFRQHDEFAEALPRRVTRTVVRRWDQTRNRHLAVTPDA